MNEIIYQGLCIKTDCKYLYIHQGENYLREDKRNSVYEISFKPGSTNKDIAAIHGLTTIGRIQELREMVRPEVCPKTTVTIGGLKFRKLTYDPHTFRIVIVGDHESAVYQSYDFTTILISEKNLNDQSLIGHILFSGGLKYMVPEGCKKKVVTEWKWYNYPRILITNKSLDLNSTSRTVYQLRGKYDNYVIRSIDYQNQFIEEIRKKLGDYGIELARYNREKTLTNSSYVSYRFSQTPQPSLHPMYNNQPSQITSKKITVEFELRCNNTQLFFDFKNRYQNLDLLTNFCEMTTMDKYGDYWTSAIKWGGVTGDFSQMYEQDMNQNFSLSCQFSAELYFYEVYDTSTNFIKDIYVEITEQDDNV